MNSYCVFCKTGSEISVAEKINIIEPSVKAIAPMRIVQEKREGKWMGKQKVLLPGYVFLYTENDLNANIISKLTDLYKVLSYDHGVRSLMGKDYDYAMWIWKYHGSIDTSKVLTVGKSVKVIEGPLLDANGVIKKLDKHKRKIWVEFNFDGITRMIVLSAECIDSIDGNDGR